MRLPDMQAQVAAWHRQRFGQDIPRTWVPLKLAEEAGEVAGAALQADGEPQRDGRATREIREEAGDVLVTLLALADREGFDLEQALRERWVTVSARQFSGNRHADLP